MSIYDTVIIGAGPGGLTAGLYCGRYRLNALIFERMSVGGQIMLSPDIENFPGFPGGIKTEELIANFKKQVDSVGVPVQEAQVTAIEQASGKSAYIVKTEDAAYETKTVIIASGAHWKKLGVAQEERLTGRGVSYCGTCDGPLFRNKEIVVVGGGDRALEDAIYLSSYASLITLVHRRQEFRAAEILQEKIRKNDRINIVLDSVVEEIIGQQKVEAVRIKNLKNNSLSKIDCQGVFIFIGIQPNTDFTGAIIKKDEYGFIITDEARNTSCPGIYACGDCRRKALYQVINACGEAAVAANSAHTYLINQR